MRRRVLHGLIGPAAALAAVFAFSVAGAIALPQSDGTITLEVVSAQDAAEHVAHFKYLINVDNTGTTEHRAPTGACSPSDPGYPNSCEWASIAEVPHMAPIYTQGDETDFPLTLPPGRYLVSVLADGYKLDGSHFTVTSGDSQTVGVQMQPWPVPDSTIRAQVFEDNALTNMTQDANEAGLSGFQGHINDYLGLVTTDTYGNPLCTTYVGEDPDTHEIPDSALVEGEPVVAAAGHGCFSDANGLLTMPHLGTNRYALSVTPPNGQTWIQTTTLEGNHDWDDWVMEGSTGYDTEFTIAGEAVPQPIFGFVRPTNTMGAGAGDIHGAVVGIKTYTPPKGGSFDFWGGNTGTKIDGPIDRPWLSLSDLNAGDVAIWVGRGNADGTFDIPNVPAGTYSLSWWDEPQDYNLNMINVTVANGEIVDLGNVPLNGWWTRYEGYVFNDTNRNGVKDAGEPGIPNFALTLRRRENSLFDRGQNTAVTDPSGRYEFESAYPLGEWIVMEAYSDSFYTTGITYQADNQPAPTTVKGAGVDISTLPIIGLSGTVDWGVHAYDPTGVTNGVDPRNGGIVGTVSYDTTRNELDPQYAAVEDWQPGVSDVPVFLYAPVDCPDDGVTPCDDSGRYQLDADGSYFKGQLLNTYVTENWQRPTGCTARDVDGNPLAHGSDENVLATNQETDGECISSFMQEIQFSPYATDQGTPDANFGATVDGNFGFGDGCFNGTLDATSPSEPVCVGGDFESLPAGDYLVSIQIPNDDRGKPAYQVTKEEDINIGNGDAITPQAAPPSCAGPLHTVDLAGDGTDGYGSIIGDDTNGAPTGVTVPASTTVDNATFLDLGGSPYEGTPRALCDTKLVPLANGKSVVPTFNVFTDVPLPTRMRGLIVDDINFSADPRSTMYGEKAGVPFVPVGIYDYTDRLIYTLESDFNGYYDVLLPSTNRINCPTPSGVCANMYRFVANDPGVPGRLNPNWDPRYRTIATEFEAFPGLIIPTDLAPTQVGVTVESPATGLQQAVQCVLDPNATPQLFAVSKPFVQGTSRSITIKGTGFGATQGTGRVALDGFPITVNSWAATQITVTVPADFAPGPHQLKVTADNGQSTVNGLTIHVLSPPTIGPFPATPVLDNFNRANNALTLGSNWSHVPALFSLNGNTAVGLANPLVPASAIWNAALYGADQEAYVSISSPVTNATEQGLYLKASSTSPSTSSSSSSRYLEVAYDGAGHTVRILSKKGNRSVVTRLTVSATFAAGDRLGARALADGTLIAYKNTTALGQFNVVTGGAIADRWTSAEASSGRIGLKAGTSGFNLYQARFDNFGGGNAIASGGYSPNLYEVGPGVANVRYRPANTLPDTADHAIQNALDDAATSPGDDLVVVYPGLATPSNSRMNPRGAYYENLIMSSPVKLQGVGPGGFQGSTYVPGTVLDASAFAGDSVVTTDWYTKLGTLTWDGNQGVSDGEGIYVLASQNATSAAGRARQFTSAFKAAIDGFDLRGGNQQGFPTNINDLTGTPTGLPADVATQGGAIFANAYARYLQITNNVVQNNGGSFGTIRIGTADLPAGSHNENVRIANNRVIQNAGTNLAGGIGLFAGSDNYEVASNDICGNFSLEYGGGLSVYGLSPNGKVHHNRIYFNFSNDEGGGVMIGGALPTTVGGLSAGSGAADVYNNQIEANLSNDDGGGLRLLMAGNSPINIYNNMLVNNVSTHEGGGVALDDAPNVRIFNNTIMKNLTTATAVTSNGEPMPAGLSTGQNSDQLQATLPAGSPLFSKPLLFNNIFWDNRAGTRAGTTVTGIGLSGDASPIDYWDIGIADGMPGQSLDPTNSVINQAAAAHPYTTSATNRTTNPNVVAPYNLSVAFNTWRQNPAFVDATLVLVETPPNLMGNYHLGTTSPAIGLGAASKSGVNAPATDIDDQNRVSPFESGADEK